MQVFENKWEAVRNIGLILLSTLSLWHFFAVPGLPVGHDLTFEMVRLVEYRDALMHQVVPSYAPHTYGGFGSPVFHFYSPLFVFGASVLSFFIQHLVWAVILWFLLLKSVSVLSVYHLVRSRVSAKLATIIALVWCFLPYGYTDLYQRNAFSEATALFLLPMVLYFLLNIKNRWMFTGVVLSTAGLLLSHNITAMLSLLLLGIVGVVWSVVQRLIPWRQVGALALGGGLSAWFLLPAYFEKALVHIEDITSGKFVYSNNFATLHDLFLQVESERFVGPVVALLLLWALVYAMYRRRQFVLWLGVLLTGGSLFLMTALSTPLWEVLPFLQYLQFPWRLQVFVSLGVIFILWGLFLVAEKPWQKRIGVLFCVLLLGQSLLVSWTKFIATPMVYETTFASPVEIAQQSLKATVGNEYLPKSREKDVIPVQADPLFASQIDMGWGWEPVLFRSCDIYSSVTPLAVGSFATIEMRFNGEVLRPGSDGYIRAPRGERGCLEVQLKRTPLQWLSSIFSLLAFIALIVTFRYFPKQKNLPTAVERVSY